MTLDRRSLLRLAAAGAAAPLFGELATRRPAPARAAQRALVTADLDGFVAVVDLHRRRVVRRIATLDGPRSVEPVAGGSGSARAIVGHATEGAVTLLGGSPLRVWRVLRGFGEPRYAAVAPGRAHAFVTDSSHGELAVVDLRRGRVVQRLQVGAGARHLTLDPAGRRLWIALGSTAAVLVVVDVADPLAPRVVRPIAPPFGAHDVAFSPSGRRVWVTGGRTPSVALYRAADDRPAAILAADAAPQHVTFGPHAAYVASGEGRSLTVHALADGRERRRAVTPLGSYNVARGRAGVVTPSLGSGELTVLDAGGRVRWAVAVAGAAHDACLL